MPNFYITTPIYYVNDRPHLGHAYTTVLADVLARYHRLLGDETFLLTGTDEHGQKVQEAAAARGIPPQQLVDEMVVPFQELWNKLEITHDDFIRTTEPRHQEIVREILQDLFDRGEIYRGEYDGWYCVPDERFFTEKELVDGSCPECRRPVQRIQEANYFFRMSAYQQWLIEYIHSHPRFIQPDFRRNETLGFLRRPLQDLCISRPKRRLSWGIELPFDSDYVTYVWFDALVNYISAIGYRRDDGNFARWPASCHLIGKDILTTHTVYWPTMLQAMGVPQPEMIFAHGWWLMGDAKMGKSLGNAVNPMDLIDRFGVDAFRYYLMAGMVLGQDANFTPELFVARYNTDLANDLGNLLSRLAKMVGKYCGGAVPPPGEAGADEAELREAGQAAVDGLAAAVQTMTLDQGLVQVFTLVRATNRYLERRQPWTQAKAEDRTPLHTTLYYAAEALRVAGTLLQPVMPASMDRLLQSLGVPSDTPIVEEIGTWGGLVPGSRIQAGDPLFPRIQQEAKLALTPSTPQEPRQTPPPAPPPPENRPPEPADDEAGLISVEEFARVQLRTARILTAERVEGTSKLLRLEVMMGAERRQIVAGIALHYQPDSLIGRTVVVVANLKPATIRGLQSQGMLLAAGKGESLRLLTLDGELSSGALIR